MELKINGLSKYYGSKQVLSDIHINVSNLQVLSLIGASGSGKSTLLRLIAGLEPYETGEIIVNGTGINQGDLSDYRKNVGFVFQDHNLFAHLSVLDNILLILDKVHHLNDSETRARVISLLKQFGLEEHMHKLPHQISGGQSQRASIVRALAIEPEIILLDEPTSSLDPVLTYEVLTAIKKLAENARDFIIVTHEIGFAKHIADYVIFMEDGKIIEHGSNAILDSPQTAQLKHFLDKVLSFTA
ncbi:amino acid ABC transporter ATP-binding protein [Fusibacter paucivorans]|uniref:Amino acid ABC transporter ATP-binding protein n=1 Tax=Fusibacter paucivorans TaxID=76009 RepID=A0ABS5PRW8_9FIRM|nr:amino acid ABC transporter ATP-binding protein [Fusibacter paucivorans]MBS7527617.1 amino acid ABC transporter ATP-binding protein [Fusibacter paucivorans]